jgi:hypothetical protein
MICEICYRRFQNAKNDIGMCFECKKVVFDNEATI